ncbi:IS110 family transposase, partial [Aeromonas caviae]
SLAAYFPEMVFTDSGITVQIHRNTQGEWVARLEAGHHHHVVLIALANKIMRICWKVLTSGRDYQPYPNASAAV